MPKKQRAPRSFDYRKIETKAYDERLRMPKFPFKEDEIEAVAWKRISGRAQQPVGPHTKIFHCVANTIGQSPDGKQTSSGGSFIREPQGLPLSEAGWYHEEMISAELDLHIFSCRQ